MSRLTTSSWSCWGDGAGGGGEREWATLFSTLFYRGRLHPAVQRGEEKVPRSHTSSEEWCPFHILNNSKSS